MPAAEDLLAAVRVVARGDGLIDPAVTRSVIARFTALPDPSGAPATRLDELTPREREVFGFPFAYERGLVLPGQDAPIVKAQPE